MELVVLMRSKLLPSDWVAGSFLFFVGAGDRTRGLAHAVCTFIRSELHLSPMTGLNWLVVYAHRMLLSLPVAEVESSGSGWVSRSCHAGIPQYVRRFSPPRVCRRLGELESWVWKASQAVVPQSSGPCCECLCSCVCPTENVVDKVVWLLFGNLTQLESPEGLPPLA